MRRLLWSGAAIVVCVMPGGQRVAVAQGATACDSPCKVILLPLVTNTSQKTLPFVVRTIPEDSLDGVTGRIKGPPDATRTYRDFQVDKPAILAPGSPQPVYPESLKVKKVEGGFVASFVVDTMGRVDMTSFMVPERGHPLFIESVREALPLMRFVPAEIQGVKVRQLVQRPFVFTLSH